MVLAQLCNVHLWTLKLDCRRQLIRVSTWLGPERNYTGLEQQSLLLPNIFNWEVTQPYKRWGRQSNFMRGTSHSVDISAVHMAIEFCLRSINSNRIWQRFHVYAWWNCAFHATIPGNISIIILPVFHTCAKDTSRSLRQSLRYTHPLSSADVPVPVPESLTHRTQVSHTLSADIECYRADSTTSKPSSTLSRKLGKVGMSFITGHKSGPLSPRFIPNDPTI